MALRKLSPLQREWESTLSQSAGPSPVLHFQPQRVVLLVGELMQAKRYAFVHLCTPQVMEHSAQMASCILHLYYTCNKLIIFRSLTPRSSPIRPQPFVPSSP